MGRGDLPRVGGPYPRPGFNFASWSLVYMGPFGVRVLWNSTIDDTVCGLWSVASGLNDVIFSFSASLFFDDRTRPMVRCAANGRVSFAKPRPDKISSIFPASSVDSF